MTNAQQRAKAALEWWNSFTSCYYKEHEDTIRKALTAMAADVPSVKQDLTVEPIEGLSDWLRRVDDGYQCNLPPWYVTEAARRYAKMMGN